jgi:hypothetical protein
MIAQRLTTLFTEIEMRTLRFLVVAAALFVARDAASQVSAVTGDGRCVADINCARRVTISDAVEKPLEVCQNACPTWDHAPYFAVEGPAEFDGPAYLDGAEVHHVTTIAAGGTHPDVSGGDIFVTSANAGATAITDLDNPYVGQTVVLCGGSDTNSTTVANSGNFHLNGAITLGANVCVWLWVKADNDYIEIGRAGAAGVEADPQVGTLTATKWCAANAGGTAIDCTQDAPTSSETDPQVGTVTNTGLCVADGTAVQCAPAYFAVSAGAFTAEAGAAIWMDNDTSVWYGTASNTRTYWDTGGTPFLHTDLGANTWGICNGACTAATHSPNVYYEGIIEVDGACYMDGGAVVAGNISATGQYYTPTLTTSTPAGTTQDIDWDAGGNVQKLDLEDATGNVTLTMSNLRATAHYTLIIQQDGGGNNRTVTFPAAWQFVDGATNPYTLTVTATADERDMVVAVCESATFCLASFTQNYTNP